MNGRTLFEHTRTIALLVSEWSRNSRHDLKGVEGQCGVILGTFWEVVRHHFWNMLSMFEHVEHVKCVVLPKFMGTLCGTFCLLRESLRSLTSVCEQV